MSSDTGAKWIKIDTDIFNNTKIRLIKSYPNGDTIIAIWFELLCLAGKTNNGGFFMISDRIPITEKMFASIFGRTENEVIMAFDAFKALGMIVVTDIANESVYTIKNWNKYQALDALEAKRERDKQYQKQRRERKLFEKKKTVEQKKTDGVAQGVLQLTDGSYGVGNEQDFNSDTDGFSVDEIIPAGFNESSNGESLMSDDESSDSRLTSGDASLKIVSPDIDTEKEEEDIEIAKAISSSNSKFDEEVEEVVDRWNRITEQTRLTPVKQITNPRRRMVNARLAQYGLNTVIETINMIPQCGFLWKGYGKNEWVITFNWLFKPENFVKVMEGTYLDKNNPASGNSTIADMVNAW